MQTAIAGRMEIVPVASALLYPYLAQNHGVYTRVYRTVIMFGLLDGLDGCLVQGREPQK